MKKSMAGQHFLENFLRMEPDEPNEVEHWTLEQIEDDAMAYLAAFSTSRPKVKAGNMLKNFKQIFLNYRYLPLCVFCGGEYATYSIQRLDNGDQNCKHCTDADEDGERDAFVENNGGHVWLSLSSTAPPGKRGDWATEATRNWRVADEDED